MGDPTPARSNSGAILLINDGSLGDGEARREERLVVDLDRSRLEKAPTYTADDMPNWSDRTYGNRIDEYYGLQPYWGMI